MRLNGVTSAGEVLIIRPPESFQYLGYGGQIGQAGNLRPRDPPDGRPRHGRRRGTFPALPPRLERRRPERRHGHRPGGHRGHVPDHPCQRAHARLSAALPTGRAPTGHAGHRHRHRPLPPAATPAVSSPRVRQPPARRGPEQQRLRHGQGAGPTPQPGLEADRDSDAQAG